MLLQATLVSVSLRVAVGDSLSLCRLYYHCLLKYIDFFTFRSSHSRNVSIAHTQLVFYMLQLYKPNSILYAVQAVTMTFE